jgi:Ca2+-binding EF-hand superfamily protein
MKDKKNKLVKSIKEKIDGNQALTEAETTELASKWMEIADFDQSGTIDSGELQELVKKLDEGIDMDKITAIFTAQDEN